MERVTGIGGIFFKANDPKSMYAWYQKHLGINTMPDGSCSLFQWQEKDTGKEAMTVWSIFPKTSEYFGAGQQSFMMNFRVRDLDAVLAALKAEGVWIDEKRDDSDFGKFAWIKDPEGNRIELWQPPEGM